MSLSSRRKRYRGLNSWLLCASWSVLGAVRMTGFDADGGFVKGGLPSGQRSRRRSDWWDTLDESGARPPLKAGFEI